MKTPKTISVVLTASQEKVVPVIGQYMHVRSCTVASFQAAFDEDTLETFYPGATYPSPEAFDQIRLKDSLGGGCTIEIIVAQVPFTDVAYDQSVLSTISTTMTAIATDMAALEVLDTARNVDLAALEVLAEIPDTPTAVAEATIAQTGVGEDQLITAAVGNRKVLIQADYANTGEVYAGFATGVTAANTPIHLQPGDSWAEDYAGDVYACSENGTEKARGYVIAIG